MKTINLIFIAFALIFLYSLSFASAITVDANYITIYPGEQGKVNLKIDNTENFDIEHISAAFILDNLPFNSIGSSEKSVDDINEDDDDITIFTIKASTDIKPGDYQIPYVIKYVSADDTSTKLQKQGTFGIRVSSKTDLDFSAQVTNNAIAGQQGKVSLEIINKGLGEIKAVSVEIVPQGFELLSTDKVFIGTINGDDTDSASFDVIYTSTNPTLNAKVTYKDFDNKNQIQNLNIPFKVYTQDEALKLGIIKKSKTGLYAIIIIALLIIWLVWRRIRKKRKNNKKV